MHRCTDAIPDLPEVGISAQRIAAGWYQNQTGQAGVTASSELKQAKVFSEWPCARTTLILYDIMVSIVRVSIESNVLNIFKYIKSIWQERN